MKNLRGAVSAGAVTMLSACGGGSIDMSPYVAPPQTHLQVKYPPIHLLSNHIHLSKIQ